MAERIAEGMGSGAPLVVADIPLLFEGGRTGLVEGAARRRTRRGPAQRLMLRDGLDEAAARARVAAQMPMEEKRLLATWVIDNGGTPKRPSPRSRPGGPARSAP